MEELVHELMDMSWSGVEEAERHCMMIGLLGLHAGRNWFGVLLELVWVRLHGGSVVILGLTVVAGVECVAYGWE